MRSRSLSVSPVRLLAPSLPLHCRPQLLPDTARRVRKAGRSADAAPCCVHRHASHDACSGWCVCVCVCMCVCSVCVCVCVSISCLTVCILETCLLHWESCASKTILDFFKPTQVTKWFLFHNCIWQLGHVGKEADVVA